MTSSPSPKNSHKYYYNMPVQFLLKASNGDTIGSNLSLIPITDTKNYGFLFQKKQHYDRIEVKKGLIIQISREGVLSHAFGKVRLGWNYGGLGELWHEEKTDEGSYYRGEGGESSMYLSYKDGRLGMSNSKGETELWK